MPARAYLSPLQYGEKPRVAYTGLNLPVGHIFLDDTKQPVSYSDIMAYKRAASQLRGVAGFVLCRRKDHGYIINSFGLPDTGASC